jgi:hypothetical protein
VSLIASDQRAGARPCGGDLLLPRFAARAGHGQTCCLALPAPTRARPAIMEKTNVRRRRDVGLTCRGSFGRNLGDDLANGPLQHSPTPTSTDAVSRRHSQRRRPHTGPDLVDTEEVTGSISVSPTSVCAAQRLVTRSWVTSCSHRVPYIGSKMGAQDPPTWRQFLTAQARTMIACDFFTVDTCSSSGSTCCSSWSWPLGGCT